MAIIHYFGKQFCSAVVYGKLYTVAPATDLYTFPLVSAVVEKRPEAFALNSFHSRFTNHLFQPVVGDGYHKRIYLRENMKSHFHFAIAKAGFHTYILRARNYSVIG